MRHFQVVLLALLTVIALELGFVVIKLPTPDAQAQTPPRNIPTPGSLQDPHDQIRAQLTVVERELAEVQRELATVERGQASTTQNANDIAQNVNDRTKVIDSHLHQTCQLLSLVAGRVLDPRLVNFGRAGACGWQTLQ